MSWETLLRVLASCKDEADRRRFNELLHSPFCEYPHCERFGELHHQNTAYGQALCNWSRYCAEHQQETDALWDSQWQEYYAGLL